jgi:uncharacterized protein YndB with AHSA1/START domain
MVRQRIEREILIDAPVDVVWAVVTEPEQISGWFSDSVELDQRPGGKVVLEWDNHGRVHGRVERVEPPRFFSFRWMVEHGPAFAEDKSTLVEFSLSTHGESTRLTVVDRFPRPARAGRHQAGTRRRPHPRLGGRARAAHRLHRPRERKVR